MRKRTAGFIRNKQYCEMDYTTRQSIPQLHLFLRSLIEGKREISANEIFERCRSLGIDFLKPPFLVVVLAPDYAAVRYSEKDRNLFLFEDFVHRSVLEAEIPAFHYTDAEDHLCLLFSHVSDVETYESFFRQLRELVYMQFGMSVFVGIGSVVDTATQIFLSASDANEMLGYRYQYADVGVANITRIKQFHYTSFYSNDFYFERVINEFQSGNLGKMSLYLDELVEHIRKKPNASKTSIRRVLVELTIRMLNISSNANIDVDAALNGVDPYHWILSQTHSEIITEWIMILAETLQKTAFPKLHTEVHSVVIRAQKYIEDNYASSELCLAKLAEFCNVSKEYLCRLFRSETGIGISHFVRMRRMEYAQVMLRNTDFPVDEIAHLCGFSSGTYFCSLFKKETGITPTAYRRRKNV